ncbi:hypothetical protein BJP37_32320 [Moorena bouillonii PNG]|uniref:Uncharacterized protein n=2 Tax=Moorena TaxID=1155738 RepID=A0A1U7MVA2_9CYAN|nr:hypothetical protein BJP37_32320 [Moorena bouillonii PNG]
MIDIDTFIKAILEPLARCQFYAGLIPATGNMPVLRGADSGHWQDASSTQGLFPGHWQDASSTQGLFPSYWQDASSTPRCQFYTKMPVLRGKGKREKAKQGKEQKGKRVKG